MRRRVGRGVGGRVGLGLGPGQHRGLGRILVLASLGGGEAGTDLGPGPGGTRRHLLAAHHNSSSHRRSRGQLLRLSLVHRRLLS